MKKVVILVGEKQSANGICADKIMKKLKQEGYKVECITNQEANSISDGEEDGIYIRRILPRLTYRIRSKINYAKNKDKYRLVAKLGVALNKIKLILSIPTWPLISPLYSYRFYRAAKKSYEIEKYDYIISIYTQIDAVIAGYFIKKKHKDIKYIPYFLDSLSGGYGPKVFSKKWLLKRGLKWEKFLLKNADKIIVMKASEKHHKKYSSVLSYYPNMVTLDIPLLDIVPNVNKGNTRLDKSKINIVYAGSLPLHIRNPKYILELYKSLEIEGCALIFIGQDSSIDIIKKAKNECDKNIIVTIPYLPHQEIIEILQEADFLLNIGNNISSMVPSKVFEYMSLGKPIISTYSIEDEPSLTYLEQYSLKLTLNENTKYIQEDIRSLEKFITKYKGCKTNVEDIKKQMYINTPEAFIEQLDFC